MLIVIYAEILPGTHLARRTSGQENLAPNHPFSHRANKTRIPEILESDMQGFVIDRTCLT